VCGWEDRSEGAVRGRRAAAVRRLRAAGAMAAGQGAGEAWRASRFSGPHLRDDLMDRGVLVETLETGATWDLLPRLHEAVRAALAPLGGLVMCHVSHLYPTGASLYFSVLAAADPDDPAGQWRAAKAAATDAIAAAGGTITHHHAVGRDHRPWLAADDGWLGVEALRAVKERLDPAGIMNPGKLLAAAARSPG
jgi:alkyldihydroxyacetonephosphate synthase